MTQVLNADGSLEYARLINHEFGGAFSLVIDCPICGKGGTFEGIGNLSDVIMNFPRTQVGLRFCPNVECRAIVFVILLNDKVQVTHPPLRIQFEKTGVPPKVVDAFREAIDCHANQCYMASAIMIRKTLEEICADKGATVKELKNLAQRIDALKTKLIAPDEFFTGMHDLRVFGNDGAHPELMTFPRVSKEEVTVAINVMKVLLAGIYQMQSAVLQMEALKARTDDGRQPEEP